MSLIYFFLLIMTIWQKYMIVFHLFFLCSWPFDPKLVLINLFFFVHNHSTKVWVRSYYLIYSSFNCANISRQLFPCILSARFITVLPLPLHFVHYFDGSATLIFRMLYPRPYEVLALEVPYPQPKICKSRRNVFMPNQSLPFFM